MYSEKVQEQSDVCAVEVSNKIPKPQYAMRGRSPPRSIKFRKSTSRIKIEMSSTPINNFLRPSHSILVDGSYSKWIDALEDQHSKAYKIRGYDRPIPGIISGNFVMYDKKKQSRKLKTLQSIKMSLSEPKREKKTPDSKIIEELEKNLEKRNASILDKIIPFMADMFANFSLRHKNDKRKEHYCREHLPDCTCFDENSPLPFVNANGYVYPYSYI